MLESKVHLTNPSRVEVRLTRVSNQAVKSAAPSPKTVNSFYKNYFVLK